MPAISKRLSSLFLVVLALALLAAGCSRNANAPKQANANSSSAKPQRIVSLAPNVTEILFALGVGDRVVGVTKYCNYPPEATKKPQVGDMRTTAEAVLAQNPDLVIGHGNLNGALLAQLKSMGKSTLAIDPQNIAQVEEAIKTIGERVGASDTAGNIVKQMQAGFAEVQSARAGKKQESVLVVVQASPELWVAGPGTFVDEMLKVANAKNAAFDARQGFVPFSKELAISRNPDVIIVGQESERQFLLTAPLWRDTSAAKNGRICVVSSDLLTRPGPRLVDGLREMAKCLR